MHPYKTSAGLQVMKDRSIPLTPRQRQAFILIDGKRSISEVLKATAPGGVTPDDVQELFALGLITQDTDATLPMPLAPAAGPARASSLSSQERYSAAYPIAARLTASLGLRGFRLNLAVEAASSYEDLLALAPKIREAVGSEKFAPLQHALDL